MMSGHSMCNCNLQLLDISEIKDPATTQTNPHTHTNTNTHTHTHTHTHQTNPPHAQLRPDEELGKELESDTSLLSII